MFVNTCRLEAYLSSLGQQLRTVVGRIWKQSLVESLGYVVSRDVAAEVVDMDKAKDQGEDANLGISRKKKLGESSLAADLTWISAAGFVNDAVWFGTQEVARDPNRKKDVLVLSHGMEERARLQDELYWCPRALQMLQKEKWRESAFKRTAAGAAGASAPKKEKWRESAFKRTAAGAADASAPTRQRQVLYINQHVCFHWYLH